MGALRNSFADCWFDIISLLIADISRVAKASERARIKAPSEDLLFKNSLIIEAIAHWYPSYFGFLTILNALHVILKQKLFSLENP